jgi:hypothetical protein
VPHKALQKREVRGAASSLPGYVSLLASLASSVRRFRERKFLIGVCSSIGALA